METKRARRFRTPPKPFDAAKPDAPAANAFPAAGLQQNSPPTAGAARHAYFERSSSVCTVRSTNALSFARRAR